MPYHHVPQGTMFADIRDIEHDGEIVVQALHDLDRPGWFHVWTRYVGQESRPMVVDLETRATA